MIRFYGTGWCGDCHMAKRVLDEQNVQYEEVDIDLDPRAADFVKTVNGGMRSVPTIVFPDGSTLSEPSPLELTGKLQQLKLV